MKNTPNPASLDTCAQPQPLLPHFNREDVSGIQDNAIATIIQAKNLFAEPRYH